jgi:uncharacterized protein (DUF362 family)
MAKGISVRFKSYAETIPNLLKLIKFDSELKKHDKIALKPNLIKGDEKSTPVDFVEQVLRFCVENKNPGTEIVIVEGSDGRNTMDVFEELGYRKLAEKYGVGLVDLNKAESDEVENPEFLRFEKIMYPRILQESFVISLPALKEDEELEVSASLDNMIGAFPARHYKSIFSSGKNKIKRWPAKYLVHDIIKCKLPEFSIIDASNKGVILAGQPIEMDKQAAVMLGKDWKSVAHLRLIDESFSGVKREEFAEAEA